MTRSQFAGAWTGLRRVFKAVVGMPDYAGYLERTRCGSPEALPLTEREFYDQYLALRFANGGWRCC